MQDIVLSGTKSTPAIETDWLQGRLSLRGDSYPENAFEFFEPVLQWVDAYLSETEKPLDVELAVLYLNTSSIRILMDLFDELEAAHRAGRSVSLNWHYEAGNERMAELAEEFREDCSFPFAVLKQQPA